MILNATQLDEKPRLPHELGKGQDFARGEGKENKASRKENHSRLGLRHVDDGAAHAADEDHATLCLALHEVAGDGGGEEVGAVDVDGEELAHAVDGVVGGVVVLGEARGRDQVVDLAVLREDLGDARVDRVLVRHVGVVRRHLGGPAGCQLRGGLRKGGMANSML